jgi:hypothetical protein
VLSLSDDSNESARGVAEGEMASFNFGFLMESDAPTVERSSAILKLCQKRIKLGVKS